MEIPNRGFIRHIGEEETMHSIKYRGCLAQQDNKTLEVTVSKPGFPSLTYAFPMKLSGKELRTVTKKYLADVS